MICFSIYTPALLNCIGLICDIAGAWLVAWEVVKQFKGKRFAPLPIQKINMDAEEQDGLVTDFPEYTLFEKKKYTAMKWGLALLTFGFLLQITANIMQVF